MDGSDEKFRRALIPLLCDMGFISFLRFSDVVLEDISLLPLLVFFQGLYLRLQTHHAAVEFFETIAHL